ncbi:MAG: phenylalanine--tRNA ligase subunit beta [Elusimicrobiota bacterium]|nr:phenylalanine--tRNA ligase subunit beta [Elusimicrobiota bacterium]
MKIPYSWLKEFIPIDTYSPKDLAEILLSIGFEVSEILEEAETSDTVLDVEIHPNRPDCLSIIGIAKELSAKLALPMRQPECYASFTKGENSEYDISVEIFSPELCKRYIAVAIYDLKVQESNPQISSRLKSCGLKPINNVVDITNYVMLEFGHPLHAFDLDKLKERKIIVRTAKENETLTALDEKKYTLNSNMLVIADAKLSQALAGIIGGKNSVVDNSTRNVLLESAVFNAENIRRTRQKLNIVTESSYRFERGSSWENADISSKRATFLIFTYCHPKFAVRKDVATVIPEKKKILLRPQRVNSILATKYEKEDIAETLSKLGLEVTPEGENLSIGVSSNRLDINEEIDLIEEIVRIKGYDTLPSQLRIPEIPVYRISNLSSEQHKKICQYLTALGFYESINYGFNTKADIEKFQFVYEPVKIENPQSIETEFLRLSLLPNLLQNLLHNVSNEIKTPKLFEIGKIFHLDKNSTQKEITALGIIFKGTAEYNFYYLSSIVQNTIKNIFAVSNFDLIQSKVKYFHPGKSAEIVATDSETTYSIFGLLNPAVHPEIPLEVYFAEIYLDALQEKSSREKVFKPYTTFPKSKRDISVLIPENITYKEIEKEILATKTEEFNIEPELIDVYRSKKLPEGKKSYTITLSFSHKTHTLTTDEINKKIQEILSRLANLKIFLRTPLT